MNPVCTSRGMKKGESTSAKGLTFGQVSFDESYDIIGKYFIINSPKDKFPRFFAGRLVAREDGFFVYISCTVNMEERKANLNKVDCISKDEFANPYNIVDFFEKPEAFLKALAVTCGLDEEKEE